MGETSPGIEPDRPRGRGLQPRGSTSCPSTPRTAKCRRRDSNPHARRRLDLNQLWLPVTPLRREPSERACCAPRDAAVGLPGRSRTCGLMVRSHPLCPLSYGEVAEALGLEPRRALWAPADFKSVSSTSRTASILRRMGESNAQGLAPRPASNGVPSPVGLILHRERAESTGVEPVRASLPRRRSERVPSPTVGLALQGAAVRTGLEPVCARSKVGPGYPQPTAHCAARAGLEPA